jgi:3-oxoadipate enol-lactonase / 4-carboxymuconolactone decarboxylase
VSGWTTGWRPGSYAERMLHHRLDGPAAGRPLVLGPSLGTSLRIWDGQLAALTRRHRVLRYDLPGHGGSRPAPKVSTVDELADLVEELATTQGWETFDYAGVSLGGAIGATIAARGRRIDRLAMVCSSARFGEPPMWHERAATARTQGMAVLRPATAQRWFAGPPDERLLEDLVGADPEGYAMCCEALAAYDLRPRLGAITAATLIIAGREDPAAPPERSRELADGMPSATLVEIAGAAHLALIDKPAEVGALLVSHLDGDPREAGMAVRRAVLGDRHVDSARVTSFTADFQDLITRYAWGEIWSRPGLDRFTRSCVTLAALVAMGRWEELPLHIRGALANGLTEDDIKEVLLHTAVYCGVPAANSAFAVAQRVLDESRPG